MIDFTLCPSCDSYTDPGNDACPYCGYRFERDLKSSGRHEQPAGSLRQQNREEINSDIRNPFIAALCSFLFIGWGQWYNGRTSEGVQYLGAYIVTMVLFFIISMFLMGFPLLVVALLIAGLLISLVIWGAGIVDAYTTAKKINRGALAFTGRSRLFWVPVAIYVVIIGFFIMVVLTAFVFGMAGHPVA